MKSNIDFKRTKILIVDDQRAFQVTLKGMLVNLGIKDIHFVESSEAAIRACRSTKFDIVLADYNLGPGRNGQQLLEILREQKYLSPAAVFFIISGESTRGIVLGALEREPDDYLVKPFSLKQLANRLERAYSKHLELGPVYNAVYGDDLPQAIAECEKLLAENSRYSGLCKKMLAEFHRRTGNPQHSEKILRETLEQRDLIWARVSLGHTLNDCSRHEEAITTVAPILKSSPLTVEAHDCIAEAYIGLGDEARALEMLKKAAELSPFRPERQEKLAQLALSNEEYLLANDAFRQVYDQSRRAIERNTEHLCNYVRSTVEASLNSDDERASGRLESEAFSTLMRARQDSQFNGFDFQNYEDLINAAKFARKGDLLKAKKLYYKATERYDESSHESQLPTDFITESLATVSMIGELEEAQKVLAKAEQLDSSNPFLKATIAHQQDETTGLQSRHDTFQQHSKAGMTAYDQDDFKTAIEEFEQALQIAPTNTGAALNLIQTLLKRLSESKKMSPGQLRRCEELFKSVDGVRLPAQHRSRKNELWGQFQQLKRQ
ncbi:tetratricopeptide repeat-containing response regulator [Neiella marina]|uniref:tetratricopeptide repeat-containing response regulator n=1 Tax=Neiella marina TaxID=508461 RepID=UPI000B3BE8B7|nr:tetratricopeptide repeat-containing response regulator [Neiella marina]